MSAQQLAASVAPRHHVLARWNAALQKHGSAHLHSTKHRSKVAKLGFNDRKCPLMEIRYTEPGDIADLKSVLDHTELFPSEMLEDMLSGFLNGDNEELWLTCESGGKAIGFCYAVPEQMAEGTWNMLALAVAPDVQGKGAGRGLVAQMEAELEEQAARVMIVDTSGTDAFTKTRMFYTNAGYTEEARIRDFWGKGDDKVTFWKALD